MKYFIPALLLLFSAGLYAQPSAFVIPLDPSCDEFPNSMRYRSFIGEVGSPGDNITVDDSDWVAAFDTDNFVIGRGQVVFSAPGAFGCTNVNTINFEMYQQDQPGGLSNTCQPPPYGAQNGEPVRLFFWDALTGTFWQIGEDIIFNTSMTAGFPQGGDCSADLDMFPTAVGSPTNTLPVSFIDFTGRAEDKVVRLNWSTAFESGNDFYTIERSAGDRPFEAIGTVDGAGDTREQSDYSFLDESPAAGLNFYRVRQTDFTGLSSTTNIIEVLIGAANGITAAVYPNPADNVVTIRTVGSDTDSKVTGTLFDQTGRELRRWEQRGDRHTLDVSELVGGVYQIRLENTSGEVSNHRVMIR